MTAPPTPSGEAPDLREAVARTIKRAISADGPCWLDANIADAIIAEHIAPLHAENESLRAEREQSEKHRNDLMDSIVSLKTERGALRKHLAAAEASVSALTAELAQAKEQVARMRGALEPFCFGDPTLERILYDGMPDDAPGTATIKLGDLRRARAALTTPEHPHGD